MLVSSLLDRFDGKIKPEGESKIVLSTADIKLEMSANCLESMSIGSGDDKVEEIVSSTCSFDLELRVRKRPRSARGSEVRVERVKGMGDSCNSFDELKDEVGDFRIRNLEAGAGAEGSVVIFN